MLDEDLDAALLRLFHCFLHAAPQAVLQLMILIFHANHSDASSIQGKEYLWHIMLDITFFLPFGWDFTTVLFKGYRT
jgi:hypothetical protein